MTIEVTGPGGSIAAFSDGTPTEAMRAALANGGPRTAGSTLAQLGDPGAPQPSPAPQGQPDPGAAAAPNLALAPLPPGGGYGPIADAAKAAASPWLNALASDPSPVWNQRLGLFSQTTPMREAASSMAGSMLNNGDSPAMAGLSLDPDSGEWTLPRSLGPLIGPGPPPTAATWLGLYHTLPSLMETDPWTGQVLSDADSPRNATIADIAGQLSEAFIGDPWTGAGGAIPGYGPIQNVFGDPFTIRAAHDAMDGTLFSSDPDAFSSAWAKAGAPAEQAAARSAVTSEIADRIQNGQILPGQMGSPFMQNRLAPMFGPTGAKAIAAQAERLVAGRHAPSADDQAASAPVVTAPPTPGLAMAPQPFVPTTPIAASLIQGFDAGGIAGSLLSGHGNLGAGLARRGPTLHGPSASRAAPPVSPGQHPDGNGYPAPDQPAPPLDDAGNPEIVITGPRRYPINYFARIPGDLGLGQFLGAASDLGRGLYQFANPDSQAFYASFYHPVPLTPAQRAQAYQEEAEQQAREHAYSLSPWGIGLGVPVAAGPLFLGAPIAEAAPFIGRGAQTLENAALGFAVKYPGAVTTGGLLTNLAFGALTGTIPADGAPVVDQDGVPLDDPIPGRPSWRQSEIDVGEDLGPGHTSQPSYLNGSRVAHGTPGSVRPDWGADDETASHEVKNYDVETNINGLINDTSQQAVARAQHLPAGMKQHVIIDVRGQTLTAEHEAKIIQDVVKKSNGSIDRSAIRFKEK